MSRRTVRDAWLTEVMLTQRISDPCRRLLLCFALAGDGRGPWMSERGRVRPIKHKTVGEVLGIAEKTVANRILEATKAGLLEKDPTTGSRGRPAAYKALMPTREKVPTEGPITLRSLVAGVVKVPVDEEPSSTESREPFPPGEWRKVPGSREAQRARVIKNNRNPEPAPDGSCGPERNHAPNSGSSDEESSTGPVVTDRLAVPTALPQADDMRAFFEARGRALRLAVLGGEAAS